MGTGADLPWWCHLQFGDGSQREYGVYFWTVSHGGKTRSVDEYRIQTKLKTDRQLRVGSGTIILLGYYHASVDRSGRAVGNHPPDGMEVFVAWDALHHLRLGASSSCQVPFPLMYDAYLKGKACITRRLDPHAKESIFAFRPQYLASYLRMVSGGHDRVSVDALSAAYVT